MAAVGSGDYVPIRSGGLFGRVAGNTVVAEGSAEGVGESTGVLLPSAVDDVVEDRGGASVTARAGDVRGSREGAVER